MMQILFNHTYYFKILKQGAYANRLYEYYKFVCDDNLIYIFDPNKFFYLFIVYKIFPTLLKLAQMIF